MCACLQVQQLQRIRLCCLGKAVVGVQRLSHGQQHSSSMTILTRMSMGVGTPASKIKRCTQCQHDGQTLPRPSRVLNARNTKVKVAGNLNGWSSAIAKRSSPMFCNDARHESCHIKGSCPS